MSVVKTTLYRAATGEIIGQWTGPLPWLADNLAFGFGYVLGDFRGGEHYVAGGVAVPRPALTPPPAAMTRADIAILTLPAGSEIRLDGALAGVATGDPVELAFEDLGDYALRIDPPFPYLPLDAQIRVSA